jgi:hypothetical protein
MKIQNREKSNYKGLTIIHPHSGKVSRTVVETKLKNYFGKKNYIPNTGYIILEDVNYKIVIRDHFDFIEELNI